MTWALLLPKWLFSETVCIYTLEFLQSQNNNFCLFCTITLYLCFSINTTNYILDFYLCWKHPGIKIMDGEIAIFTSFTSMLPTLSGGPQSAPCPPSPEYTLWSVPQCMHSKKSLRGGVPDYMPEQLPLFWSRSHTLAWRPSVCLSFPPLFVRLSPTILWRNLIGATTVPPGPFCQTDKAVNWVFCHTALPSLYHHLRYHSCWEPLVLLELHLLLWTRPCDTWSVWLVTVALTDSERATCHFPVENYRVKLILITTPLHSAANFSSAAEGHSPWRPTKAHHQQKKQRCNPETPKSDTLLALAVSQDPAHENQEGDWPTTRTAVQLMKIQLSLPSHVVVSLKNLQTSFHQIHKAQVDRPQ